MSDWADEAATKIVHAWFSSRQSIDVFPFDVHLAKALREARAEGMSEMRKRDEHLLGKHGYTGLLNRMDPDWQSGEESTRG